MIIDLSTEALEYGRQVARALEAAGGDHLVEQAEADPSRRDHLVAPVLDELGAWDLDPRASSDEMEAAAALCRSAGTWGTAYPVAERLARPLDLDVRGQFVVNRVHPSAPVVGLEGSWSAIDVDGRRSLVTALPPAQTARKSAFVTDVSLAPVADDGTVFELALGLVLPCWTLLGMLDRAMDLTRAYVLDRKQFGQPLARFQSVQFQLTDAEVERIGVEELAKYALWSLETRRDEMLADALALRLATIEAAETVFRICHQLHGAIGFCDETTVSWLSRHSQPIRRLPLSLAATRDAFTRQVGSTGLDGLFDAAGAAR